jgi:hypothetical protein
MINPKVKSIIFSIDLLVAILLTLVVSVCLPKMIEAEFTTSFYSVGISVLSIVFSLFFAALAIIISSSDSKFVDYMENENGEVKMYTLLLFTFKATLVMLFVGLSYSILINSYTDYFIKHSKNKIFITKWFFVFFVLLFSYSMLATAMSIKDTFRFTTLRLRYIDFLKLEEKKKLDIEEKKRLDQEGKENLT